MKPFVHPTRWLYATLVLVLLACTEEEVLHNDAVSTAIDKAGSRRLSHSIKVRPSGDMSGFTDANAIENALLTISPGGTVLLAAGKYFIARPVVAYGFNGTLQGEGKKETRILGVGSVAEPFPLVPIRDNYFEILDRAVLFHFPSPTGKVNISNLSVSLKEGFFSETIPSEFIGPNDLFAFFVVDIGYDKVNTTFHDVGLKGIDVNQGGPSADLIQFQPSQGIVVNGLPDNFPFPVSGGKHKVTHCHFNRLGIQSILLQLLDHAQLEIQNNHLTEVKQILTRLLNGSQVVIENNHISNFSFGAIVVTQEFFPAGGDKNLVFIRRNTIHTDGFMGIEIGAAPNFQVFISYNHIEVGPDPTGLLPNLTGIGLFQGQDRAIVYRNTIKGSSEFAISLFGVSNSLLLGNNVLGHNSSGNASYRLDYGTYHNLVINQGEASFIDEGIDNKFIFLSGFNGRNLGSEITKKLRENHFPIEEYSALEHDLIK